MSVARAQVSVIVAAAGGGSRLGLGAKAMLAIDGETLLARVLRTARVLADDIVVSAPADLRDDCAAIAGDDVATIEGGAHRCDSFARAFARSRGDLVLLLDVARPFASVALCHAVLDAARTHGAAGAFVRADVPAAVPTPGGDTVVAAHAAADIRLPQMPQAFARDVLARLFADIPASPPQTVWQLALMRGVTLAVVDGEPTNIKITHPLDWSIAQRVIAPLIKESPAR